MRTAETNRGSHFCVFVFELSAELDDMLDKSCPVLFDRHPAWELAEGNQ